MKQTQKQGPWYTYCLVMAGVSMVLVVGTTWMVREIKGGIRSALGALFFDAQLFREGELVTVGNGWREVSHEGAVLCAVLFLYALCLLALSAPGLFGRYKKWRAVLGAAAGSAGFVAFVVWGAAALVQGGFPLGLVFAIPLAPYTVLAALALKNGPPDEEPEQDDEPEQEETGASDERTEQ